MTTNSINTAQVSGLVLYQVSAIFLYAVGLGSEASKPGLGLAGWETASGDGQFNSNGVPIHPDQIKENSGYTAGNLQWDFGQRHNGDWAAGYQAFINTFSLSPEWNALTADQQNQILTSLPMNGDTLKTSAANMLNQVEFDELDAFLKTPLGIDAAADLDQTNILVTSAKGLDSANIVAANGGDEAAQTMAAVVGLKLFNQGGIKAYNAFEQDLQDQTIKTADDIQTWVSDNYTPKSAIGTWNQQRAGR
ncbi:hypothetical protein [Rhizobium sp. BK376]|uniref:hypothetical protein n=1 Tax=Rhizobium sp. BK376 TaxID=2512149 RepID=UPI0010448966|nr:hypothetical protein [Rhizobium sp. BK376]TCR63760.1 hypothetical protein EV561_1692 [Rhizobium sp. BK376]